MAFNTNSQSKKWNKNSHY